MEYDWLAPRAQWGLRTWITLALLSLLPIGLIALLLTTGI